MRPEDEFSGAGDNETRDPVAARITAALQAVSAAVDSERYARPTRVDPIAPNERSLEWLGDFRPANHAPTRSHGGRLGIVIVACSLFVGITVLTVMLTRSSSDNTPPAHHPSCSSTTGGPSTDGSSDSGPTSSPDEPPNSATTGDPPSVPGQDLSSPDTPLPSARCDPQPRNSRPRSSSDVSPSTSHYGPGSSP